MKNRFSTLILVSTITLGFTTSVLSADSKDLLDFLTFKPAPEVTVEAKRPPDQKSFISGQIWIDAPQALVWQTIHDERTVAPDLAYSRVISEEQNSSIVEQRWNIIPFLKQSRCTMSEIDYPKDRIDFKLLKSDEFKVMEGSWILKADGNVNGTTLELTTYLELRRFGSQGLVKAIARRKIAKRLAHIKELAEAVHPDLHVEGKLL